MKNLFENTSSYWVRYSQYEYRTGKDGLLYITPAANSQPILYDPLENYTQLVLDALNLGMFAIKHKSKALLKNKVIEFVSKYGLLGFLTALPTTPGFMNYEAVYLPKNHFIKEETMQTEKYLEQFFPFDKLDVVKNGVKSRWNLTDRTMIALALTLDERPMAVQMCCQRQYAERFDWLVQEFKDWAFTFVSSFFYYKDYDSLDELSKTMYQSGMAAFGGIAPTYHIELRERPTMVWDFHSLLLQIQMLFTVMLTDDGSTITCCDNCGKVFVAVDSTEYCCAECESEVKGDE